MLNRWLNNIRIYEMPLPDEVVLVLIVRFRLGNRLHRRLNRVERRNGSAPAGQCADEFFGIQSDLARVRTHESREVNALRQLVEVVRFERFDLCHLDLGVPRELLVRQPRAQTSFLECLA
jgi:hypothetical protein